MTCVALQGWHPLCRCCQVTVVPAFPHTACPALNTCCSSSAFKSQALAALVLNLCRCYEVKCQTGLVIANYTGPASNPTSAAELQTISQGYTPAKNVSAVTDTFGRTAPVNPLLSQNLIYTNCWNNTLVRVGCPSRCIIMWQLLCSCLLLPLLPLPDLFSNTGPTSILP